MERFMNKGLQQWLQTLVFMLIGLRTESSFVDITFVQSAVEKGAVCLDGSPPAYYLDRGFGEGINSWLVHFEGGGWCESIASCLTRRSSWLGSTTQLVKPTYFSGILSNYSQYNPDFYNWNRVMIRYCDGSSFTGDVEAVDPATKLYYRGGRIFYAVMEDLLEKGMRNAENAMLSGCSAGGLTSILHCDGFRDLLPMSTNMKCISDAGYFINVNDTLGNTRIEDNYDDVVTLHGSAKNLPTKCTSEMKPSLCFFPQNMAQDIKTPLFIINSPYDTWQIYNILAPGSADLHGHWNNCTSDLSKCTGTELQTLHGYRSDFIEALTGLGPSKSRGYFINSCYTHCQTEGQDTWFGTDSPMLNNKTIAKAVGDWFYDRSPFQKIDCPYPCDKTCHNQVFGP